MSEDLKGYFESTRFIEPHVALEQYAGTFELQSKRERAFMVGLLVTCSCVLSMSAWNGLSSTERTLTEILSTTSLWHLFRTAAVFVVAFVVVISMFKSSLRRTVTLSPQGVAFDAKEISYPADEVRRVRRQASGPGHPRAANELQVVIGWPRTGLGRIIPWRREAFRIRLPHERKRG